MTDEAQRGESGRARVKRVLIGRLEAGGMMRKRGVSVADHDAAMDKLADRLAYMSEQGLKGLAMYLVRMSGERNVWPALNIVLSAAWSMEPPPPTGNDYLVSLMRSRAGEAALSGGYALELYAEAKRLGPPPSKYQTAKLRERAGDNRHRVGVIEGKIKRGCASEEDRRWLENYYKFSAEAEALIHEGKAEREKEQAA